jgi:hypothetical protein
VVSDWKPSAAAHQIIMKVLESSFGEEVVHIQKEYDHVVGAFEAGGGSWYRFHRGSVEDIQLLKRLVKAAVKKGHISRRGFPDRR